MTTDMPPKLAPGTRRLSISWLNALRDAVASRTVRAGPGIMASRGADGTTVSADHGRRGGGAVGAPVPRVYLCRTGDPVVSAAGYYVTAGAYLTGAVGRTGGIDESDWKPTMLFHCGNGRAGGVEESDLCIGIRAGVEILFCLE